MMNIIDAIRREWTREPRTVAGIMTGTSVDAVDVAAADFHAGTDGKISMKILAHDEFSLPLNLKDEIMKAISRKSSTEEISSLNSAIADSYREAIEIFRLKHPGVNIDAIGIHGQTVWHDPACKYGKPSSTLQLGAASRLSALLQLPVVSDFRSADIAVGGQGAPLVPIFDHEYLSDNIKNTIALNIGGIANISFLPCMGSRKDTLAFDTGPGNILIDSFMKILYSNDYDEDGQTAIRGNLIENLYNMLMNLDYIKAPYPKSTGRELFNTELIYNIYPEWKREKPEDIITTLTQFTASSIADSIINLNCQAGKIAVSGGGAKNSTLMNMLRDCLRDFEIVRTDTLGIPSDAKEALCFAYLAFRTLAGLPGNIPSVTGADSEIILGSISCNFRI